MTIKAVLCDIDGTLVDSNWLHAAAWRDAFEIAGVSLDLEQIRRQIGKGGDELVPVFVPWWKREILEEPLKRYQKIAFKAGYLDKVKPFPMVREFFLELKKRGIQTSLASSAEGEDLKTYRQIANIDDLIEENGSSSDANRSKPHPDIFQATLRKLGASPDDVLALGDTPYDAEAAGKARIRTVGVTTGGWSKSDLMAAGCIEVYDDVADLLHHFDESAFVR